MGRALGPLEGVVLIPLAREMADLAKGQGQRV